MKNENDIDDMISILEHVNKYVPVVPEMARDPVSNKPISADCVHQLLFGGDKLTRKRSETAIELRQGSTSTIRKLKGIQPVCEDWHAKKCFLEVSKHLFHSVMTILFNCRLFGIGFMIVKALLIKEVFSSYETL